MIKRLSHRFRKEHNCWRYLGSVQGTYLLPTRSDAYTMEIRSNKQLELKVGTYTKHPKVYA